MIDPAEPSSGAQASRPDIDLEPLFAPRSIAIVGASPRSDLTPTIVNNLTVMGSATRCYLVNPNYTEAWGLPCYPDLAALPEVPDAVLAAVNPARATLVTQQAADVGARAVLIPGGGVVEGGEAAARMQRDVRDIALRHGLAVLGPNCMGMVDWTTSSALYIGDVNPWLPRGGVAGIAQSGSVTDAFIHSGTRIGFSRIVGSGAEVVLDVCDYLAHSLDDPETHTIILFVEGFKRPERFLALADLALQLGKPILAVKVGRSAQAQEAAVAHSGSIAGEDRVTDAALAAAGVIRCADLDELLESAELHAGCHRMGRSARLGRTGVVTVSTGEASLIADLAAETGLDLPPLPDAARSAILRDLPTMGYIGNPIDPWGAADEATCYPAVFRGFAESGAYDVLAIVHDFPYRSLPGEVGVAETVTRALIEATAGRPDILPAYVSLTSGEPTPEVQAMLDAAGGIPLLRGAREAELAIVRRAWWERRRAERSHAGPARPTWPGLAADRTRFGHDDGGIAPSEPARAGATGAVGAADKTRVAALRSLSEYDSLVLLRAAGVAVVDAERAADPDAAAAIAARSGDRPLVVKLDADDLPHKSDIGAVRLGLVGGAAVHAAASEIIDLGRGHGAQVRGVLVEPMADPGIELIVGMTRDPLFGPAILVGFGGIFAEVLDDAAIRLAPLTYEDALIMLASLRGSSILDGARGRPAIDRAAVAHLIVALGRLAWERSEIVAVDINPVIAGVAGALAVDALVVLAGEAMAERDVLRTVRTSWGVRLVLDRPDKLNALSHDLVDALDLAITAAGEDPDVRVVVIEGAGRAFSAGYDLNEEVDEVIEGPLRWRDLLARDVAVTLRVWDCPKPVIAQVHGYCLAGGLELAMACDLIVAAEGTKLGEPEIRYGSAPVTLLMPSLIGQKKTRELLLTGDLIDAGEAERIGLVNRVVQMDQLATTVDALADQLARTPPEVMQLTKRMLNRAQEANGLREAVAAGLDLGAIINAADTPEQREWDAIVRSDGLKAALAWRDRRYEATRSGPTGDDDPPTG